LFGNVCGTLDDKDSAIERATDDYWQARNVQNSQTKQARKNSNFQREF